MEYVAEIMKLIESGLQEDSSKVLNYSNLLINKLEKNGDKKVSQRFKKIIKFNKTIQLKAKDHPLFKLKTPIDAESSLPLAEIKHYLEKDVFLSVSKDIQEDIDEFINLIKKTDILVENGLKINRNLLMHGPSGTGKTQAAKYISAKTNLPLVIIRIDGLISSYLGNTSKNIRTLFNFVEKTPCILFLDEFDAIAKMRDDSNELGELKRVVNTLLQNIDSIQEKVPILAATNHKHLLDSAVWRRFDYKLFFNYPHENERKELISKFLNIPNITEKSLSILITMTKKLSGAEIEILCNIIKTSLVLKKIDKINEKSIFDLFLKYQNRSNQNIFNKKLNKSEKGELLIKSFRQNNKKVFDYRTISKMLGISLGTVSKLMKKGGRLNAKRN